MITTKHKHNRMTLSFYDVTNLKFYKKCIFVYKINLDKKILSLHI